CRGTIASPLVEPDVRVSRIRLSQRRSPQTCTGRPRPRRSQGDQAQKLHLGIDRRAARGPVRPLAATPQVFPEAPLHVAVDLTESSLRIAKAEIGRPASQVTVQVPNQLGDRDAILLRGSQLPQLHPLPSQGLGGGNHIQVAMPPPLGARTIVPKRETQKVQTRSLLPQLDHPRLLPVDLQPHQDSSLASIHPTRRGVCCGANTTKSSA